MRLDGATNEMVVVKPNVHARNFDTRGKLVMACDEMIVETDDGKTFFSSAKKALRNRRSNETPRWIAAPTP